MDKDLLKFENRSDDWLAKQKKEESYVSAWDFDEGKKIKEYHQDNCEATQIKQQHEYRHQMYNKKVQEIRSGTNKINKNFNKILKKRKNTRNRVTQMIQLYFQELFMVCIMKMKLNQKIFLLNC